MISRGSIICLSPIILTMIWIGASAQWNSCINTIDTLSPCLDYITGNDTAPSISCCTQLGIAIETSPQCVCTVITGGASSLGINVEHTKALALPGACKVQGPPLSLCNGESGGTTGSTSSPSAPSASGGGFGGGSNTNPIAQFSYGTSLQIPVFLILLCIACYPSILCTSFKAC